MTTSRIVDYLIEGKSHEGLVVQASSATKAAPTVLVFHAWDGRTSATDKFAQRITEMGFNAFATDLYGKGVIGITPAECQALMNPLVGDRARLRRILLDVVDVAAAQPEVDAQRMAAIGFCFGGLCVLDLARTGAPLHGVASFHGLYTPSGLPTVRPLNTKIIAYHGWDDPLVLPNDVTGFGQEFTEAGADWQLHAFGGASHAFMAEGANVPGMEYNAVVADRAWRGLALFLEESLGA